MKKQPKFFLEHIIFECEQIVKYTQGKSLVSVENDYLLFSGICRMLTVIGEAVAKIPDDIQQRHPAVPWRNMKAMRNVLVHQYYDLDYDLIWNVATKEVPDLLPKLKNTLSQELTQENHPK